MCPDVSQSMEREENSVEVDLMSVSRWREKATVWRWTVSLCQCVLTSASQWRDSLSQAETVVRCLTYTVSNALARRLLHSTCLINCHYLLSVSVIVYIDIESLGLGKVFELVHVHGTAVQRPSFSWENYVIYVSSCTDKKYGKSVHFCFFLHYYRSRVLTRKSS